MAKFTKDEDSFILENYLTMPMKRISKLLGRGESSARQRLHLLGFTVPKEIALKFKKDSQKKPGSIPLNKGKKQIDYMTQAAIDRSKNTRFKKGGLPPTTLYDGCITIRNDKTKRNYQWIRISKAEWRMLHVVEWEKVNGSTPEGYIIVFKNGDTMNTDISNLELITFAENMRRNTIHRYPVELKQTIRLLGKLKRKIKDHGTEQNQ